MRPYSVLSAALFAAMTLGCGGSSDAAESDASVLQRLDSAEIRIFTTKDTVRVIAELAKTPAEHSMGLMERTKLAENRGMLFLYSTVQPESSAYWMFRTRIPLDIAFIDSAGVIRSIRTMTPCTSTLAAGCTAYPAGAAYRAALEVNGGFYATKGIRVGHQVSLGDTLKR
jgi:uncharacterized protein